MKWAAAAAAVALGTGREYIVYFMLIFTRIQNDFPIVEKYSSTLSTLKD